MTQSERGHWQAMLAVAVLTLSGCGPRAAIQLSAADATATPDCASEAHGPGAPRVVTAVATAVVAKAAQAGISSAQVAPTPVPRAELVRQAVATATVMAQIPTPTPAPTSTPTVQPVCATPPSRPTASAAPPPTTAPAPTAQARLVPLPPRPLASPSPASVPSAPSPVATLVAPTVLLPSDAGSLVLLHVTDRFVLLLGQYTGVDWQIELSDPSILQRVGSDGQGVYQAARNGDTTLTATGNPACLKAQPPCMRLQQSRALPFTIRVQ